MSRVILYMAMSLDGFITGPGDGKARGRRRVLFSCRGVTPSPPPAHSEEHEACDDDPSHEDEMDSGRRLMLLR